MSDRWVCMICGYMHRGAAPPKQCPNCGAPFTAFQRKQASPKERLGKVKLLEKRQAGFRTVIVGNSAAGRSAAQTIRALDPKGKVTVLSEEAHDVYARPLLPDLIGGMDKADVLGSGEFFEAKGLEVRLGVKAERLDIAAKRVVCADGGVVEYDALLLATGSAPVMVAWPGSEAEGIAYFRSFADAERIAAMAAPGKRAVVVGGGLLGLEFVRCFLAAGLKVTQLVRDNRVGAPAVDERAGPVLTAALEGLGVVLVLADEVASFEARDTRVCAVNTAQGQRLECELVGVAVGVKPRVELAKDAGLTVDRGVIVDRAFRTSAPGVFAAGDVAQAYDHLTGENRVNTSWRNSIEQGEAAGIAMAGGEMEYSGAMAANYQLAAGLAMCTLGSSNPPDDTGFEVAVSVDVPGRTFHKTVKRDGKLVGACLIGDLDKAGEYEEAIRSAPPGIPTATPSGATGGAPVTRDETPQPPVPPAATTREPPVLSTHEPRPERSTTMNAMTETNLKDAFAGESQAHMKYLNFAEKAVEDGKENVARLFRAASYAEQIHASTHLGVLEGVGTTSENLAGAAGGESFEIDQMYPAYIAVAELQGEEDAQETFDHAWQAEKVHHALYVRAKEAVDAGGDLDAFDIWVCTGCGFTMEGEPPDRCPVCKTPKRLFTKF